MTALRFSSDQLFSASRRTLRAYTTPSSVRTKCSSVRSLLPSHTPDFPLSANFGAGFPDPFCVGCDIVQADHAPEAGVAQGIFHGILVRHQGRHQEEVENELEEEVERRVKREHSSNQTQVRMHG